MDFSLQEIKAATCMVHILGIILVVAVVAFFVKSRLLFLVGTMGSFLGIIIPERKIYISFSNGEAAFMWVIDYAASHVLTWGIVGAILGMAIGYALTRWIYQEEYQQPRENAAGEDNIKRASE
jgi:hypothetical protein